MTKERQREQWRKNVETRGEESIGHNLLKQLMFLSFGCQWKYLNQTDS